MKTRHVHRHLELGRFWFALPVLGALIALTLLTAWPDFFSQPLLSEQAAPPAVES